MDTLEGLTERIETVKDLINMMKVPGAMVLVEAELALTELYDSRDNLRAENDRLRAERDGAIAKRDVLSRERDAAMTGMEVIARERDALARRMRVVKILSAIEHDDERLSAFVDECDPLQLGADPDLYIDRIADMLESLGLLPKEER